MIHKKLKDTTYQLRELDGTVKRESIAVSRLKVFYYREEVQTVQTAGQAGWLGMDKDEGCRNKENRDDDTKVLWKRGGVGREN